MPGAQGPIARVHVARTPHFRTKCARAALAIDFDAYLLLGKALEDPSDRLTILREGAVRGKLLWAPEISDVAAAEK